MRGMEIASMTRAVGSACMIAALTACGGTDAGNGGELISSSSSSSVSSQSGTSSSESASQSSSSSGAAEAIAWDPPAGNATVAYDTEAPFLNILTNLGDKEIATVSQGRELFIAEWLQAPGTRETLDGLGPLFNAGSCIACHVADGRVVPFNDDGTVDDSFLLRPGNAIGETHPVYGDQFQTNATAGLAEASITWQQAVPNGPVTFISNPDIAGDGFSLGPRIAPQLLGMGLLDLVSEATILAYADPEDENGDGISGRAHWVVEENETRIGRFGWKAINSTLRTQNAGAMHQDMGLTTPVNPGENCTQQQEICDTETSGGSPEVSEASLMAIVNFMTALGVPDRRIEDAERFDEGARIFERIGCASCHRPTMTTGESEKFAVLSHQKIYPYTDLLLHDMGEGLDDGVMEKNATTSEWRTPPLWCIGIVAQKEGARFLHDGRAMTIEAAVLQHGGEAAAASEAFTQLSEEEKENLLMFLRGI